MRSITPPPRRLALLEVTESSERGACSPSMAMTSSPVPLPRQQPIKVSADGCFSSPKPGRTLPTAGEENLAPLPCLPAAWASPRTPGLWTTPNRMPVVKEEAEFRAAADAANKGDLAGFQVARGLEQVEKASPEEGSASSQDVNYMPAWISSSPGLEDDAPLPGFGCWGSPKIRNTFLQFESPLRTIRFQTPPKSVPSHFAPVGCGQGPGPLGRLIDASPLPAAAAGTEELARWGPAELLPEEPRLAAPAPRQPCEDVMRLRLDDFLAPGPAAQQPPTQGDFQQAMQMPNEMEMMQWICSMGSMGMGPMPVDQQMGAAGFVPQADGQGCGMQPQVCMGSAQAFPPQDCMGQLGINLSGVPSMADATGAQFAQGDTFDASAGAFQVPTWPAQAPAPAAPVPTLFPQQVQPQATAQQPTQPQPSPQTAAQMPQQPPVQLQQMAMQIQKLLQIQQPTQPPVPAVQPMGPQLLPGTDAGMIAMGFPAPAGSAAGSGAAPSAAPGPAAGAFAPGPSSTRWADKPEATTVALPPFPMFSPAAEQGGGRISISVGHFPEPGTSSMVTGGTFAQ